jgi:hypothetical protein
MPWKPFLTDEICAPCSISWPSGERVVPIEVSERLPQPQDYARTSTTSPGCTVSSADKTPGANRIKSAS